MNNVEITFVAIGFTVLQMIGAAIPTYWARASLAATLAFYTAWQFAVAYGIHFVMQIDSGQYAFSASELDNVNQAESISFTVFLILLSMLPTSFIIGKRFGFPYDLVAGMLGLGISFIPLIPQIKL